MKEHPLIFSTPMVQAILDGRKTMTRRIGDRYGKWAVGDKIWVRETYIPSWRGLPCIFKTDKGWQDIDETWTPSIFMPRCDSRILLEIIWLREEYLQDISPEDVVKEGILPKQSCGWAKDISDMKFRLVWDSLYAKRGYGWATNPIVRVIEFKRLGGGKAG